MASSSSSVPSGGHAAPSLGAGPSHSLASAANVPSAVHARLIQIRKVNAWGLLAADDELNSAALTEPILVTLLGLDDDDSADVLQQLKQPSVRIKTIGTLLTAAEFINPDNTLKPGACLPATLHASILAAIAALRDKVVRERALCSGWLLGEGSRLS